MKRTVLFLAMAVVTAYVFYACSDASLSTTGTSSTNATEQVSTVYIHPSYDVQLATFVAPTLESEASFNPYALTDNCPPPNPPNGGGMGDPSKTMGGGGRDGDPSKTFTNGGGKRPMPLPFLPMGLNLTPDQITILQAAAKDMKDCMQKIMEQDRPRMQAIIKAANDQRKQILADLKSNKIDRKTAATQLKDLEKTTRDQLAAIDKNPAKCECIKAYLEVVRATLSPADLVRFEAFIAKVKGFCFDPSTGTGPGLKG
ncbi:MAG: hypothetical protein NT007_16655 [Candidatus Kapabacteria bacterium]|nr:hypothetical protein [Candidatus Kapabacteria bacterium]